MNRKLLKASVAVPIALALTAGGVALAADPKVHEVHADTFDPAQSNLVASGWISGIGCPTNATNTVYDGATNSGDPAPPYTDPACTTGDDKDMKNQGLLLAKTGPTANFAAAVANVKDAKGLTVTELGYDIRKPGNVTDARGSHCGAGAPRFDVTLSDGSTQFIGCNSPAASSEVDGKGWIRLRWTMAPETVTSIQLVFDEGQDTGPDNFGLAVLDNIDVNGNLIGQGNAGDLH